MKILFNRQFNYGLNQKGMSLVFTLGIIAVIGLVTVAMLAWNQAQNKIFQQSNVSAVADQIKQRLLGLVLSPQSWQKTKSNNASAFAPSSTPVGSRPQAPSLDLYSAESSTVYYRATDPQAGFTIQGKPCEDENFFNAETGNDLCPFHYDVKLVTRTLLNGNWIDTVSFKLTFRPKSQIYVLNTQVSKYSFEVTRNFNENSVETVCISAGGVYNAAESRCQIALTQEANCSRFYQGPTPNSDQGRCGGAQQSFACLAGQAFTGLSANGTPLCAGFAP